MSFTRNVTVFCDGCGNWEGFEQATVGGARRVLRKRGWLHLGAGEDYCPACIPDNLNGTNDGQTDSD